MIFRSVACCVRSASSDRGHDPRWYPNHQRKRLQAGLRSHHKRHQWDSSVPRRTLSTRYHSQPQSDDSRMHRWMYSSEKRQGAGLAQVSLTSFYTKQFSANKKDPVWWSKRSFACYPRFHRLTESLQSITSNPVFGDFGFFSTGLLNHILLAPF